MDTLQSYLRAPEFRREAPDVVYGPAWFSDLHRTEAYSGMASCLATEV